MHDLWDIRGKTGRARYAIWGAVLVAVKYNLDRLLAAVFGHAWSPFDYLNPRRGDLLHLPRPDWSFLLLMIAVSLPFIWAGVCLTARRLRDVGWPIPLVGLFFVPAVNYLFFLVLALTPGRDALERRHGRTVLARLIPDSALGSAAVSLAVSVPMGIAATAVAVLFFKDYGWGVFAGLPFWIGMVAVLVYGYKARRPLANCLGVATLAIALVGFALIAVAIEGFICVLMAAPIAIGLALLGGLTGYFIQVREWTGPPPVEVFGALLLAMPGLLIADHAQPAEPPLLRVTSMVEIDAPPEAVWRNVVSFQQLDPATEWYFQTGLAYPVRAEISGSGVGAVRHCVFSTGAFVEPIEVWDENRRLGFGVSAEPPPMQELSPYPNLRPPHLDHYFSSQRGEFLLIALPGNRTRLEGTTWYRNRFWPQAYWQLWSAAIIHRIHVRVLDHVKRRSEARTGTGSWPSRRGRDRR
jgi:uncharacterized membrane protein YhaH (DUF805 family)